MKREFFSDSNGITQSPTEDPEDSVIFTYFTIIAKLTGIIINRQWTFLHADY